MHIQITTQVKAGLATVQQGFNESLFRKLSPPFPVVDVERFDGCETGDVVVLRLQFGLFSQVWESTITSHREESTSWEFVDEGTRLPFFLKSWRHRHLVVAQSTGARIVDDIHYTTGTLLTDVLLFPALWLQFVYRKPIYRRVFRNHS